MKIRVIKKFSISKSALMKTTLPIYGTDQRIGKNSKIISDAIIEKLGEDQELVYINYSHPKKQSPVEGRGAELVEELKNIFLIDSFRDEDELIELLNRNRGLILISNSDRSWEAYDTSSLNVIEKPVELELDYVSSEEPSLSKATVDLETNELSHK